MSEEKELIVSTKTLVTISVIIYLLGVAFYLAGIVKDVEAIGAAKNEILMLIERDLSDRQNIDAEMIQEQKSMAITINEIEKSVIRTDANVRMILKKIGE